MNSVLLALALALAPAAQPQPQEPDWLRSRGAYPARAFSPGSDEVVLDNGLVRRRWRIAPNVACVEYARKGESTALLRAIEPEAEIVLNGIRYKIGGLDGQTERGYLREEWLDELTLDPQSFRYAGHTIGQIEAPFAWDRVRGSEDRPWPPPGTTLTFAYSPPPALDEGLLVLVRYELYDDLPLLSKQVILENRGQRSVHLDRFTAELLAAPEPQSRVGEPRSWELPALHVETDFSCGGDSPTNTLQLAHWVPDPRHTSQVNYRLQTPNLLRVELPIGPGKTIAPGERFKSFRTFELAYDSSERERRGLSLRRMYRTIAPWITENPILMHIRSSDPDAVRSALDQCAEVGFEMAILTFGSGFDIESEDPAYRAEIKSLVDYGLERGVELGGYSLFSSRRISDEHDVIDPATGKPGGAAFGNAPCAMSAWGLDYFAKLRSFIEETGLRLLEHDGPYPGDYCASTSHPGHESLLDSQWNQFQLSADFYRWCRARGVSLNVPDWYFLNGATKIAMGYREVNWSLPRPRQVILGRQNIFDGTWTKAPSMGWMFVPLVEYQGGGAAATLEPLSEHRDTYGQHLANNFAAGVQACYRGPRLYDSPETKTVVKGWVDFYKAHRAILESDVLHLRRADGRDWDGLLHVNPFLEERAMLVAFNPTDTDLVREIELPLYYAGLDGEVRVTLADGETRDLTLDRTWKARLDVTIPAQGMLWASFSQR